MNDAGERPVGAGAATVGTARARGGAAPVSSTRRLRRLAAVTMVWVVAAMFTDGAAAGGTAAPAPETVPEIVERYLDRYFETFPSRATAAGRYDHDRHLERLDEAERAAWIAFNRETAAALDRVLAHAPSLPRADRYDAQLLSRQARRVLFDWVTRDRPRHDPLFWSRRLANATVMLTVREDRSAVERLSAAAERARQLPALSRIARAALADGDPARIPSLWVEMAERQSRAAAGFYREGFARIARARAPGLEAELTAAGAVAGDALDAFADFLAELRPAASGSTRLGEDYAPLFALYTDEKRSPAEVLAAAEAALAAKRRETAAYARSVWAQFLPGEPPRDDAAVIRAAFARVAEDHAASAEELVADFKRLLVESEQFVRERGLVTLPDPLTVTTDRSPAYFTGQGVGGVYAAGPYAPESHTLFYLPTPSAQFDDARREAFFRDFNDHFNVMITPHEMIPGHYLQGKYAARHPRKVRSLFADGVYTEGWGTFCERLMLDEGWGGPLDRLAHLKKQLENIARTIVDIRVHTDAMTREQVLAFVREEAFQEAHFAGNMWMRANTSSPQITSYWLGYSRHRALFTDYRAARGESFDLRSYMDAMVAEGGLPVSAYREILLEDVSPAS
jgi:uncharacterized protein (DUF885 family)